MNKTPKKNVFREGIITQTYSTNVDYKYADPQTVKNIEMNMIDKRAEADSIKKGISNARIGLKMSINP